MPDSLTIKRRQKAHALEKLNDDRLRREARSSQRGCVKPMPGTSPPPEGNDGITARASRNLKELLHRFPERNKPLQRVPLFKKSGAS